MLSLRERIARQVAAEGPISIAQFTAIALHDTATGYYATRDPLGADFTTAPEITQIFGELLGLWCAQVWHDQGRRKPARLVELGPGRGSLMRDALRAARLMPAFLDSIEVAMVENSPVLAEIQKKALQPCTVPIRWVSGIADLSHDRPQFSIANEFLDALPIHQYVFAENGWCERMVSADTNGNLAFVLVPAPWTFSVPPERGEPLRGAVYEVSPSALALVEDIARGIARSGGAALFIDYGYAGTGFGETLQAVGKNAFQGVLSAPGTVDISAHVDFGAIARTARAAGAAVFGPRPQGEFLASLGIREREEKLLKRGSGGMGRLGVKRLIAPEQMGTLFKALAILPKSAPPPPGFLP